ncbi:methyltransferase [Streptomyces acidiscabies]|uniref:methyltransferase n=1 Tax=Streptomyces acidiscabies TaxID=42234 RepID=UPI000963753D|nr:methyltransferase [Streptomyces acidiscabies]GAV40270.1 multifunctional cyclase-dehydratase-3-O-methyl transferase [Streptomyces acidiscabies]
MVTDATDITRLNTAYAEARILHSAVEVGVFELLAEGPRSAAEICAGCGLHPRLVQDFLNALVAQGLLVRDGESYADSTVAREVLVPGGQLFLGGRVKAAAQRHYHTWGKLTEALRDGAAKAKMGLDAMERLYSDPVTARAFFSHMDANNAVVAPQLAARVDWSGYRSFVDAGGARGNVAAELVLAHPHLEGHVMDLAQAEPLFDELMAERGTTGHVTFHPGDFFTDALPPADVIVFGHVLHDWSAEQRQDLVNRAFQVLPAGGALVVYDQMLDEEAPDLRSLIGSLNVALLSEGGSEYTVAEFRAWAEKAGFRFGHAQRLPRGNDTIAVAHKD